MIEDLSKKYFFAYSIMSLAMLPFAKSTLALLMIIRYDMIEETVRGF